MAKIYWADGSIEDIEPSNESDFTFDEIHEKGIVEEGGLIEIVSLPGDRVMVIDEEGKLKGLPTNPNASEIFAKAFPYNWDFIAGNALVCKSSEI